MGISDILAELDRMRRRAAGNVRDAMNDPAAFADMASDRLAQSMGYRGAGDRGRPVGPAAMATTSGGNLGFVGTDEGSMYNPGDWIPGGGMVGSVAAVGRPAVKAAQAVKRAPTEFELRHAAAQRNAALPVEEGGLGLPPGNTAAERAQALGFGDISNPLYHGSLHDIRNIDISRSDAGGHAGQGFYTTPSPKDASMNYASISGPDIAGRVGPRLWDAENAAGMPYRRTARAVGSGTLSPRRAEVVAKSVGMDNLGAVYPVVVRRGKAADSVYPERSGHVGPAEQYDEALDEYRSLPDADLHNEAGRVFQDYGVEPPEAVYEAMTEGANLGDLWKQVRKADLDAYDDMGEAVSPGGIASEVVRAMGADSVTHPTQWGNPQLNIAGEHTIALKPENVRSVFAAFDPMKRGSNDMLGFADPRLLGGMALGGGGVMAADYLNDGSGEDVLTRLRRFVSQRER